MFDIKFLRDHPDDVRKNLENRNHSGIDVDEVLAMHKEALEVQHANQENRERQNTLSKEFGARKKRGEDIGEVNQELRDLKQEIIDGKAIQSNMEKALETKLLEMPNMLDASVPVGTDESDNRVERTWGEIPKFDFEPKDHVDLGEALGIFDFETAAKLARARFNLSKGPGARLERALINFMLDVQTEEHGYTEMLPPFMVNSETMQGTGQLPKFGDDLFRLEGDLDLWLIPTAEVPLTNIHAGDILEEDQLPICYAAYTPCFRSEAGSYGKDTRGMLRQHQFNKVELVKLTKPKDSFAELDKLTADAETILQRLEIPFRTVTLCSGDTGFCAARTHDIEVWLPGQDTYREISSCSNCTDFQARRANIRYRRPDRKKPEFVHTLNGSGLAAGRTVIAVIENYQNADGSVTIPEVLRPYMGGLEAITA